MARYDSQRIGELIMGTLSSFRIFLVEVSSPYIHVHDLQLSPNVATGSHREDALWRYMHRAVGKYRVMDPC